MNENELTAYFMRPDSLIAERAMKMAFGDE